MVTFAGMADTHLNLDAQPQLKRNSGPLDGTPRLDWLPAARHVPLTVSREDSLRHAETQMLLNDYSQLPVMTGNRTVHGLISWKSIGRAHVVRTAGPRVADCMDADIRILA